MTDQSETPVLIPAAHAGRTDLITYLGRIGRLAPDAPVRLQAIRDGSHVVVWAIVIGVLVRREFSARLDGASDITVPAAALLQRAEQSVSRSEQIALPPAIDSRWRATLPPSQGFTPREDLPLESVVDALDLAGSQLRTVDDAALSAVADSMLSQTVVMVDRDSADPIELPMRLPLAMSRLGFLGRTDDVANDVLRVASAGAWVVAATRQGAAFRKSATLDLLGLH